MCSWTVSGGTSVWIGSSVPVGPCGSEGGMRMVEYARVVG